ncbi:MAG: hypothetical protein AAFV36_07980 [Myxococcota bacterium]
MPLIVSLTLVVAPGCGPHDVGGYGGALMADEVTDGGVMVTPSFGARLGMSLDRCTSWPLRVETQLMLEPGFADDAGAVSVRNTGISVPILVGVAWPISGEDGFEIAALFGPEARYDRVTTEVLGESSSDQFFSIAYQLQPSVAYRWSALRVVWLGLFRFDDPFQVGSALAVDFPL